MRKTRLFTPGPTPLIPEAQLAMAKPIAHHRTPGFTELLLETRRNLQQIFGTQQDVVILASSGTGAMEAAVCSLLGAGDHALAVVAGKFGERWVEICETHQIECISLETAAGTAATAEEICEVLTAHPEVQALLIQGCETSTATAHDLEKISRLIRKEFPDVYMVVDAITALLTQPVETDAWGLDAVISGSQKSFGLPPGLAFLALSARALDRMAARRPGSYYLSLAREAASQRKGQTAFTPAISLIEGLHASTREILAQGCDRVIEEAERMARCTREGLKALGFKLLSSSPANAVTGAFPPDGVPAPELMQRLESEMGVKVAGGQGDLKKKIVRIAHLGYLDLLDVVSILSAVELCLLEMGMDIEPGRGVGAALKEAAGDLVVGTAEGR